MPEKLPVLFSESFDSPIWKINSGEGGLLISTRDQESREVSFSFFDLTQKKFLWKNILFENSWWVSVVTILENTVIFQVVVEEDIERKSLFAFHISTREVLWVSEEVKDASIGKADIFAKRISDNQLLSIDRVTGDSSEIEELPEFHISEPESNTFHYTEGTKAFEQIRKFVKLKIGVSIVGSCDYAEVGDKVLISVFSKNEEGIVNELIILNAEGDLIRSETLERGLAGVASDTFFIVNEALIFVKNRKELVGLLISE